MTARSPGLATLAAAVAISGSRTATAVNGVATFPNLSLDQSGRNVDPDVFNLSVADGPTLLNASFAVHPFRPYQSYPAEYPTDGSTPPSNARHTGALAIDMLGYSMDAVYRLTYTFAHTAPTVAFRFTAPALEGLGRESWGLDNVEVRVGRP